MLEMDSIRGVRKVTTGMTFFSQYSVRLYGSRTQLHPPTSFLSAAVRNTSIYIPFEIVLMPCCCEMHGPSFEFCQYQRLPKTVCKHHEESVPDAERCRRKEELQGFQARCWPQNHVARASLAAQINIRKTDNDIVFEGLVNPEAFVDPVALRSKLSFVNTKVRSYHCVNSAFVQVINRPAIGLAMCAASVLRAARLAKHNCVSKISCCSSPGSPSERLWTVGFGGLSRCGAHWGTCAIFFWKLLRQKGKRKLCGRWCLLGLVLMINGMTLLICMLFELHHIWQCLTFCNGLRCQEGVIKKGMRTVPLRPEVCEITNCRPFPEFDCQSGDAGAASSCKKRNLPAAKCFAEAQSRNANFCAGAKRFENMLQSRVSSLLAENARQHVGMVVRK